MIIIWKNLAFSCPSYGPPRVCTALIFLLLSSCSPSSLLYKVSRRTPLEIKRKRNKSIDLFAVCDRAMAPTKEMEVVKGLDVGRYMGRWYEIASFPSRFQPKAGTNTRATYTLKQDGTIDVLNETWSDGKRGYIQGTAYKADPSSDEAKLKVKFYVPPFLPIIPVVGDYWVLFIDDDYQYALIGQPSRNYLWILSRNPRLDEEIYSQLLDRATAEGYDVSKLHKTPHADSPPEEDDAPKDTKGIWWIKSIFGR